MRFLSGDVSLCLRSQSRTHRNRRITFLPSELTQTKLAMDPFRGFTFDFLQHVTQAVGGAKANEEVDMIGYTAYGVRKAA